MATRSPAVMVRTSAPTASTTPMASCPIRRPVSLCSIVLYGQRSLPQIAARLTATRASVGSMGRASGAFSLRTSPALYITVARMVIYLRSWVGCGSSILGDSAVDGRRGAVLPVGDVLAPGNRAARVVGLLHGYVGHEAVWGGAVPVVLAGLKEDAVARPHHLDGPATALAEPHTLGDVDVLSEGMIPNPPVCF